MEPMTERRQLPAWLLGLIIAIVVFALGFLVFRALGFGDDPVIGGSEAVTEERDGTFPASSSGSTAPSTTPTAPPSGSAETDGLSFTYWDGTPGSFADFRGQPLVVNFWASWCPACLAEMPDFESVHAVLGDEVQFLGANIQEIDRREAQKLLNQTGVSYTLMEDPDGEIYNFFGGISMPTTVFIDAEGNVADTHSGAIFAGDLEATIRDIFGL